MNDYYSEKALRARRNKIRKPRTLLCVSAATVVSLFAGMSLIKPKTVEEALPVLIGVVLSAMGGAILASWEAQQK